MDRILIEGLEIRTVIGIYAWERNVPQTVRLDLEMAWDVARAAARDEIGEALNYKEVCQSLVRFVERTEFKLIETLAEACARRVMEEFHVPWLRLKVSKPGAVRGAENVAVCIERGRP